MEPDFIAKLVRASIERGGFEVVDLRVDVHRRVRAWVDREPSGVSVADCTSLSRALRRDLEVEGIDSGSFHLEVLSPGVDRLIARAKDVARFAGQDVTVRLRAKRGDRRVFTGVLEGCDGHEDAGDLRLHVRAPAGEAGDARWTFDLAGEVEEVRLRPKLSIPSAGEQAARRAAAKSKSGRRKRPKRG